MLKSSPFLVAALICSSLVSALPNFNTDRFSDENLRRLREFLEKTRSQPEPEIEPPEAWGQPGDYVKPGPRYEEETVDETTVDEEELEPQPYEEQRYVVRQDTAAGRLCDYIRSPMRSA